MAATPPQGARTGRHIVVVNRWAEHYAAYERYVDHAADRVTYVTTEVGRAAVPDGAADLRTVGATDDLAAVAAAVRELAAVHGGPDHVVALKEDDLLVGARLREEWGCPGPRPQDLAHFRDKHAMADRVARAGLAVPAFALVRTAEEIRSFGAAHGWPLIVKPLAGSSSAGVRRLDGPEDAEDPAPADGPLLAQAYDPRPIYHVDGVFTGEELAVVRASRYLNTCLDFRGGTVLGSVEESDPALRSAIADYSVRVLRALSTRATVFHLELFVDRETGDCAFLEVGARAGGAEIPFVWRELHGYDLVETAFRIQLGLPPAPAPADAGTEVGGWLLAPAPAERPCRITEITSMTGRTPGPYAEALLARGDVLPEADSYYEHVGGRFRFRGASSAAVEEAIRATAADFRVRAVPHTGGRSKVAERALIASVDPELALDLTVLTGPKELAAHLAGRTGTVVLRPEFSADRGSALFHRPDGPPVPEEQLAELWERGGAVVAHDYLPGRPYFANGTVRRGELTLADCWECFEITSGAQSILTSVADVPAGSALVPLLTRRLQKVVDVAGTGDGPVHFELVIDGYDGEAPDVPESALSMKIVKFAPRAAREPLPTLASWLVEAPDVHVGDYSFVVHRPGRLARIEFLDEIRSRPSYAGDAECPEPGAYVSQEAGAGGAYTVWLRNPDRAQLLADIAYFQQLNETGIFTLAP
ncbi:ATP-grasp domain-containing protein [Streptomyces sp. NPDC001606]